jgi:acetolactate synthase-1/2/3 large subunit
MPTGGEYVYDALRDAGVDLLVGLPGTQTLPLDRVVAEREGMRYVMARHETAVPHYAWGYYEAGGGPAATLTVPGPGDTNAMHGLKNAAEDCVPLFHVSADADPADRGKNPIHEIDPGTYESVVKRNVSVESAPELDGAVRAGIESALSPPTGPVRLGVPSGVLAASVDGPRAEADPETVAYDADPALERAAAALGDADRPVVYVGGGARRSPAGPEAARDLVEELNAPFVTSYKGKGVVPEDDPRWLGTTAKHLNAGAEAVLEAADVVLALGCDLDLVTTADGSLPLGDTLVHVNVDPGEFDAAYEADVRVVADAGAVGRDLCDRLAGAGGWDGDRIGEAVREEYRDRLAAQGLLDRGAPANTPAVLDALREALPRRTAVATDIGGFRLWALQRFEAYGRRRYVTAGSWAGMGVGLPAALGAKLARPEDPVVCLHGDGGLFMCLQELHTAAEEGLGVPVVVFENADYGTISKSPEIRDHGGGRRFAWGSPDFPAVAEGLGCEGVAVETPAAAADETVEALERDVPTLVNVTIDREEPSVVDAGTYEPDLDL